VGFLLVKLRDFMSKLIHELTFLVKTPTRIILQHIEIGASQSDLP
jgi:hypothetical protein